MFFFPFPFFHTMPQDHEQQPEPPPKPIPSTPLDAALLLNSLRRQLRQWRERAASAGGSEADLWRIAEADLSRVIEMHADTRRIWEAARDDLVAALSSEIRKEFRRDP